jgi:RHS repeat-associated protein
MRRWSSATRRARIGSRMVGVCAIAATLTLSLPAIAQANTYTGQVWSPGALPVVSSVPGHNAGPAPSAKPQVKAHRHVTPGVVWPSAASATVSSASSTSAAVSVGGLPVSFAPAPAAATVRTPASMRVAVESHAAATAAGLNGALLSVSRADGANAPGSVSVRVNYKSLAQNYGGDYASRLTMVELPACALTTPNQPACRVRTPIATSNDQAGDELTATVPVAASAANPTPNMRSNATSDGTTGNTTMLGVTSGTSGSGGDFTATSLSASGSWSETDNAGGFSYSYPISAPDTLGGTPPKVSLDYDSQTVDGETSGRNTQASVIGDGWTESAGGYVERSYEPCSQDGIAKSQDECWGGYNATLSLDGQTETLIRDDVHKTWRVQSDDGTSVEELSGANNGVWNGEYWLITTTEGTRYYFGLNHLPGGNGGDQATNSAWGVPVYNPNGTDPCNTASAGSSSWCQMGYRWNLDYVVDPHGNVEIYDYGTETNYYDRAGGQAASGSSGTLTAYTRGGYLTNIAYGETIGDAIAGHQPAAEVVFTPGQRCVTTASMTNCSYSNLNASTAANWSDTPYDLNCPSTDTTSGTGSTVCSTYAPTFWSTYLLASITTKVLENGTETAVDNYALGQSFLDAGGVVTPVTGSTPDPGDAGSTQSVMFLASITHSAGGVPMPATTFTATELDNRVDGDLPAGPPLYRPRVADIVTGTGSTIAVNYETPACSRVNNTMPSSADTNTMPCFPVYWSPASTPVLDWFNKYLVQSVSTSDSTGSGSPIQTTGYTYNGGAAWHRDDSPLTKSGQRTWDQYRGYASVTTTTGTAPDPVTQTVTTYLRGMNGDATASGGTKSVSVSDTVGDSVTDDSWLAGQALESDTYTGAGGTIDAKTVNGPWTFTSTASQAQPNSLPTLTARMPVSSQTRGYALLANGSWRTTETRTAFDGNAQPAAVDAMGDLSLVGTANSQEKCTTTSYATPPSTNSMMLDYADEVIVNTGACSAGQTQADIVSDTRTYYNGTGTGSLTSQGTFGTITGAGDPTGTAILSGYDSTGKAVYLNKTAATFDEYGRTLSAVDANGNVDKTAYTPATGALPTTKTQTNAINWVTTTTIDEGRQLPTKVVDQNGETTVERYDPLGRLTAVWLPGRPTADSADDTYAYSVTGTSPTTITSNTLREDGSYSTDIKIYDGLRQLRQEQKTAASGSGRIVTDTFYDSHGWTTQTTSPYSNTDSGPSTTLFVADPSKVPATTETTFDGEGRSIASAFYSDAIKQWQTTTSHPGADETDVTPPAGGTATSLFTNALGQKTASYSYTDATVPTGKASDATVINYTYTPTGKQAGVSEGANTWTYTYNLLGEKTSQTDPYTGRTTYGYDADGNLTSTTDARNKTVLTSYDGLNRKKAEYVGSQIPANMLSSWTYDTIEKGYPTSSTTYTGGTSGSAYTQAVTGYTADYRPTGTSVTIPGSEGKLAGIYTTGDTYTSNTAELASTSYSADGGLPAETVDYSYDQNGQLLGFGGNAAYLDTDSYTALGQLQRTTFGNYGKQLVVTAAYDAATGKLTQNTVNLQPDTGAVDTHDYTYNQAGDVTSVSDAQNTGGTDLQCYAYDDLQRLTSAWSDTAGTTVGTSGQVDSIGTCNTNTPAAATIGGPAPYWQSYTYDALGDRTGETQYNTAGVTADNVTQKLAYANANASSAQTDTITSATTTSAGGTSTVSYGYDLMGNTTSRSTTTTGTTPPAGPNETFTYTPTGEAATVTTTTNGTASTSSYTYAADGSLLLQRDPGSTTLYLDGGTEELVLNTAANTVSGLRYYASPDGTTVVRSSSGAITYELANSQATNVETIDASTLAVTRRYFDPYGNARGPAVSWVDNHGYVGQPADPATGLSLLGAREYDPVTGRFLQVDPLLETGDPNQMGGYTYAGDNPSTGSDPNGQRVLLCTDGPGSCITPPPTTNNGGGGTTTAGNGGGTNDDVDQVIQQYFGNSLPPGTQEVRLHDPYKFNGGIIVARFFIPQHIAVPSYGVTGDNRSFSTDPSASSRMVMVWDTNTGDVRFIISPSHYDVGPVVGVDQATNRHADVITKVERGPTMVPARPITIGTSDSAWVGNMISPSFTKDGVSITYHGLNSITPCCAVIGTLTITSRGTRTTVHESGMAYPSLEVIRYSRGESPTFLAQSDMASFGGMNSVPGFERMRDQTWVNGSLTSSTIYGRGGWSGSLSWLDDLLGLI